VGEVAIDEVLKAEDIVSVKVAQVGADVVG